MSIEVSGLYTYPIKSCAGIELQEAEFTELGIAYDREWMIVDHNDQMVTQRKTNLPPLALIKTEMTDDSLIVRAENIGELIISKYADTYRTNPLVPVSVFTKSGVGRGQGKDAEAFFSEYLGKPAQLLRIQQARTINSNYHADGVSQRTGFADGFQALWTSVESLVELNKVLAAEIPMDRFRPNIVTKGLAAYMEDYARKIKIGELVARVSRPCARCPIPNIDQSTGYALPSQKRAVTTALRQTRHGYDDTTQDRPKGEFFGQNLSHVYVPGQKVRLGDTVELLEGSLQPNVKILTHPDYQK
jgi:uncharacterized protein YcbX